MWPASCVVAINLNDHKVYRLYISLCSKLKIAVPSIAIRQKSFHYGAFATSPSGKMILMTALTITLVSLNRIPGSVGCYRTSTSRCPSTKTTT
jgi:hypothetical protein